KTQFDLGFAKLEAVLARDGALEVLAPNAYVRNWLAGHHMALLTECAGDALGPGTKVRVKVARSKNEPGEGRAQGSGSSSSQATFEEASSMPFPDRYTFETFIAGPSNKFAHAAALAVAEAPP